MSTDVGEKSYLSHTAQDIDDTIDEVRTARGASANLDTRIDTIDGAIADIQTDITTNIKPYLNDGSVTDAVEELVNIGAKNRCTVNSGSATLRTSIPVNLPAGDYVISIGEITSTDTDASVCLLTLLDSSSNSLWSGGTTRGQDKEIEVTISGAAASFMIYASDNYSHSSGDTVTFSNLMICSKTDWDISHAYVPYCPTMPELYEMIGGGSAALNAIVGSGVV